MRYTGRDSEPGTDVPDAEDEMADDVIACVFRWEQEYLRAFLPHTHAAADASDVSGGGDGNNGEEEPPPLWHDLPCTLARLREEVLAALVQQAPQLNALAANQLGTATAGRLQAAVNDALVPLRAAIDDPTAHAKVLLNMGRVLDQSTAAGDTQALREAAVCWGEAWGLEPRLTEALFSKAYALHRLGEVDAACACYAKVIEAQPSHSKAWYNLGYLKAELDDQVAAIECFTHAAELSPADAACRVHLGNAYKLDPSSVEARYNMGALLQARGDGEGATEHFRRATEIDPLCADAHFNLGIELLAAGDAALAIRCLETVLSIEPDNEDARELASSLAE
ncbi:hypothetical protein JKP88DRAFT_306877 [Tribonema minus]|uniref:Tetratricopeptide repeat protein n=1 Tax=Tribonema minus TaxID=303371 RepID=A0A835ZES2_9STRA|nr:hypothetical protein JKP88DRAFT_306877 [Tribonema minus]